MKSGTQIRQQRGRLNEERKGARGLLFINKRIQVSFLNFTSCTPILVCLHNVVFLSFFFKFVIFVHERMVHMEPYWRKLPPKGQFCWLKTTCATTVRCCHISRGQVGTTSNYGDGVQIHPCSPDSDNPHWSPLHLSPVLPNHPTMESEGGRHRERLMGGKYRARKQCKRVERQSLGETALERPRQREIWTKQPHISLPRDVTKALCAAMMHMIRWRGLCSNHRGLAVLTREYLNPLHSHQHLSPLLASQRHVPGQTVNGIGEDLKTVLGRIWMSLYRKWLVLNRVNKGITPTVNATSRREKRTSKPYGDHQARFRTNSILNPVIFTHLWGWIHLKC